MLFLSLVASLEVPQAAIVKIEAPRATPNIIIFLFISIPPILQIRKHSNPLENIFKQFPSG
jgi:hypothetical protein